ncbi:NAD(P)H-dependent oxidoreductase [Zobellella maritima]|uniref:NAD(P)H-dependent oxidoreductase n=1 Tax=Zobellella maritima TaxID=2059725 RepID=UPI000E305823|nr:NAD(P)H-dependent oxidoreductase [Zobellella maritima]
MSILTALDWRYAVRRFAEERIDEQQLEELLTATRMSASAYGLQPYRLIVVASAEVRRQLLPYGMGQEKVAQCSHLVVLAAQTEVGEQTVASYVAQFARVRDVPVADLQRMSDHLNTALAVKTPAQRLAWAHQQAYLALGTLLTSAALMGIDSCPMTGIEADGFDRVLGLTELGLTTSVACALGRRHPDDANARLKKVRLDHQTMVRVI